eukprot:2276932-Rhodomonas_salina.1
MQALRRLLALSRGGAGAGGFGGEALEEEGEGGEEGGAVAEVVLEARGVHRLVRCTRACSGVSAHSFSQRCTRAWCSVSTPCDTRVPEAQRRRCTLHPPMHTLRCKKKQKRKENDRVPAGA